MAAHPRIYLASFLLLLQTNCASESVVESISTAQTEADGERYAYCKMRLQTGLCFRFVCAKVAERSLQFSDFSEERVGNSCLYGDGIGVGVGKTDLMGEIKLREGLRLGSEPAYLAAMDHAAIDACGNAKKKLEDSKPSLCSKVENVIFSMPIESMRCPSVQHPTPIEFREATPEERTLWASSSADNATCNH